MNTVESQNKTKPAAKLEASSKSQVNRASENKKAKVNNGLLKRQLKYMVPEYKLVLVKEPGVKPSKIAGPEEFQQFLAPLSFYPEEHFIAFHLDTKHHIIGYHEVSKGTLNASLVHPREVFKAALLSNAHAIIVAHNHPSGSVEASREDIETTKQLIKAGNIMGVTLLDHCIVSSEDICSLRETRPELWSE